MRNAVSIVLMFVISVLRQSHEECHQHCSDICDFSVKTEPWGMPSVLSRCLWFQCTDRALRTAVWIVLVVVISVYRTKPEDWCRYCPCVCGFRVRTTIRLLSVLFCCLWFQCTERAMRTAGSIVLVGLVLQLCLHRSLGQVYSRNVLLIANQPQNNTPLPPVWKRGQKRKKKKKKK